MASQQASAGTRGEIRRLIARELTVNPGFIQSDHGIDAYLVRLFELADFVCFLGPNGCKGFVAYYCNDFQRRHAFVSLLLVAEGDRRHGLGQMLMQAVVEQARRRHFETCGLEVSIENLAALRFYESLGYREHSIIGGKRQLEMRL